MHISNKKQQMDKNLESPLCKHLTDQQPSQKFVLKFNHPIMEMYDLTNDEITLIMHKINKETKYKGNSIPKFIFESYYQKFLINRENF